MSVAVEFSMPHLEPSSPPRRDELESPLLSSHSSASASASSSSDDDADLPAALVEDLQEDEEDAEGEDGEEEEEEELEPCERYFVHVKHDGPVINLKRLRSRSLHALRPATSDASQQSNASAGSGGADDVQLIHARRRRRHDDYDKADPFIDDTELPAERDDETMEPVMAGFYVQRGAVALKDSQADSRVKKEHSGDDGRVKKKRKRSASSTAIAMSAALQDVFIRLEAACMDADVLAQADVPHRRLPDDVNALFSDVMWQFELDSATLKAMAERKALLAVVVQRLETCLGMSRPSLRQKMKNLQIKWAAKRRQKEMEDISARLKLSVERDVAEYKQRAGAATSAVPAPPYKAKWSLLMADVLQLSQLALQQAGVKVAPSGNPMEQDGWQVQRQLFSDLSVWWGGLLDSATLESRVKASRKARRKKEQEKAREAREGAAAKQSKRSSEDAAERKDSTESKEREKKKEKAGDKQDSGARDKKQLPHVDSKKGHEQRTVEEKARIKARREKRKREEAAAAAVKSDKPKSQSQSQPQPRDGDARKKHSSSPQVHSSSTDKADATKRVKSSKSSKPSTSAFSSSPPSPQGGPRPLLSSVFYEPPEDAQRWSTRYFPIQIAGGSAPSAAPAAPSSSAAATQRLLMHKANKHAKQQSATR